MSRRPPREYVTSTQLGGMTHRAIAAVLGISCARVQQLERQALAKLTAEVERRGLEWTE